MPFNLELIPSTILQSQKPSIASQSIPIFPIHYAPYNVATHLSNVKANIILLDVFRVPKQQLDVNNYLMTASPSITRFERIMQDLHEVFSFDDDIFPYKSMYDPQIYIHQRDATLPQLNAPCFSNS